MVVRVTKSPRVKKKKKSLSVIKIAWYWGKNR